MGMDMESRASFRAVKIADIRQGNPHRKELGAIDELAASMAELGQLQPIGLNTKLELRFGTRRIEAAKRLGWESLHALVFDSLDDTLVALKAERDENTGKPFTMSELTALATELEEAEREDAKRRQQQAGGDRGNQHTGGKAGGGCGTSSTTATSKTRDKVGAAIGMSGKTYEQAKRVVADGVPELVAMMDRGDLSVKDAAVAAGLSKKDQARLAAAGAKAVREKVRVIRDANKPPAPTGDTTPATKPTPAPATTIIPPPVEKDQDAGGDADTTTSPAAAKPLPTPPEKDAWGIPVQAHAAEAFAAVPKFRELLAAIDAAQRLFNEVANLPGGKFLTLPDVSSYRRGKKTGDGEYADRFVHEGLERARHQVRDAAPKHTVCPYQYADAPHPDDCRCCRGLNWTPALSDSTPKSCVERAKAAFGVTEGDRV